MRQFSLFGFFCLLLCSGFVACEPPKTEPPPPPPPIEATAGTQVVFDVSAEGKWKTPETFFDLPYPSDLRLNAEGGPDMTGFPNKNSSTLVKNVLTSVGQRKGFPVVPVAYFRFSAALANRELQEPIPGQKDAPLMLLNIDEASPYHGTLYPIAATVLEPGVYVPDHLLAISTYPGIVLPADSRYAFVVMRSLKDAKGELLGVPKVLNQLKASKVPDGPLGQKLSDLYAPLWKTLQKLQIKVEDVAAATVFTVGDVVKETARISEELRKVHQPTIKDLKLDADDGDHPRYCELWGKIVQPQFQQGTAPFNKEGLFVLDANGIPQKQRDEELPVVITIPKSPMPKTGYPLMLYIHGSGGYTSQVVDRGFRDTPDGEAKKGEGPAHVVAPFGVGTAGSAMPVNPERVPNANDFAYLNLANLSAFRDTFRQGVIESRLLLDALLRLRISPDALGSCKGPTLPDGETQFFFSSERPVLMGQSMGGMYTNMIGAVEPRFKALIPTGAGGYWSFFALNSNVSLLNEKLLRALLNAEEMLTYTHPVMHLLQTAWEPAEPLVYLPRLSTRPLEGHTPRHIYQPVGESDSYFPEVVLDIMTLAYGNQQAGNEIWPQLQKRLAIQKLDGIAPYPVKQNRTSPQDPKQSYTGVVVQYKPDDISKSGHYITFQLDEVKYQYGCFVDSFVKTGIPTVPAPAPLGTPCP